MTVRDYTKKYFPYAAAVAERYGLPVDVILTQSGLESGWGEKAFGNNFFGIKVGKSWTGEKQLLWTYEYINGKKTFIQSWFRKYPSIIEGWLDYGRLITSNKRYHAAVAEYRRTGNSITYIYMIAAAGYATKPTYATDLINTLYSVRKYMPYYTVQRAGLGGLLVLALLGIGGYFFIKKQKENDKENSDNH